VVQGTPETAHSPDLQDASTGVGAPEQTPSVVYSHVKSVAVQSQEEPAAGIAAGHRAFGEPEPSDHRPFEHVAIGAPRQSPVSLHCVPSGKSHPAAASGT